MKITTIVDYGLGNLDSVSRAIRHLGSKCVITAAPEAIASAERLILPGVGAFGKAMANLRELKLIEVFKDYAVSGRPILGICLGMQLFMDVSQEQGEHAGLGLVTGKVVRFPDMTKYALSYKVPHIGYSQLVPCSSDWSGTILDGVKTGAYVYFVHSYVVISEDLNQVLARTMYGNYSYCTVITKNNIFGCQFHPEKSGEVGLKILNNFININ